MMKMNRIYNINSMKSLCLEHGAWSVGGKDRMVVLFLVIVIWLEGDEELGNPKSNMDCNMDSDLMHHIPLHANICCNTHVLKNTNKKHHRSIYYF